MEKIADRLRRVIVFLVSLQGVVLVIFIGTGVFFRYVVGQALSWPEEVAGIIFVWFTLLGIALLTQSGEHIEFSFLQNRFGPRMGKIFSIFTQTLVTLFSVLMIAYGYTYAMMFSSESTPAAGINTLWLNLSLPISGLLVLFYSQLNIIRILKSPERKPSQR
ncbi:MAG: TRAP transporter small permease [Desulfobacterales bacterium]|jgi:TRAP-type C4-dicarboxylate transport system permease small subunit|nr:TRAP transporter small permease [Desulfobacterales bacterium]